MSEKFHFKPLSNYIVVNIELKKERKQGNIYIPETVERKVIEATVVAISEEKEKDGTPMVKNVKIGDKIIFDIYAGQAITVWGKEYICLRESQIFGIVEPDPNLVSISPEELESKLVKLEPKVKIN